MRNMLKVNNKYIMNNIFFENKLKKSSQIRQEEKTFISLFV